MTQFQGFQTNGIGSALRTTKPANPQKSKYLHPIFLQPTFLVEKCTLSNFNVHLIQPRHPHNPPPLASFVP